MLETKTELRFLTFFCLLTFCWNLSLYLCLVTYFFLYCAVRKRGEEMLMGHHSIFFWRKISIGWLSTLYQSQSDKEIAEEASVSICTNMYFATFSINSDWCKACISQNWLTNCKGGSTLDFKQARKLGRCDSNLQNLKTLLTHWLNHLGRC